VSDRSQLHRVPYTLILLAIILGYSWLLDPLVDVRGMWRHVPTVLVLAVCIAHNRKTRDWGFDTRALVPACKWAVTLTTPFVAALWLTGHAIGTPPERPDPWLDFVYLIFWGAGQQFALQTVVLREAQQLAGRAAVPLAAIFFAGLHLPNPFLTAVTGLGGLLWCWIYARHPNIIPLALSHAVATLVILVSFDPGVTGGLRTGWRFIEAAGR
jgi:membrane protease YdiL (CAAX protease family)